LHRVGRSLAEYTENSDALFNSLPGERGLSQGALAEACGVSQEDNQTLIRSGIHRFGTLDPNLRRI
jgi:hypothetical protein